MTAPPTANPAKGAMGADEIERSTCATYDDDESRRIRKGTTAAGKGIALRAFIDGVATSRA